MESGTPVLVVGAVIDALSGLGVANIHPMANVHVDAGLTRAGVSQPRVQVTINEQRGVGARVESVDVDAAYGPQLSPESVLADTTLPLVRAVIQGVSACLLVTGNCDAAARHWFDATPGVEGGALANTANALFAAIAARELQAAAAALPGAPSYAARVHVSAVAVADSGPTLLDLFSSTQFASAPPMGAWSGNEGGGGLCVMSDDSEGCIVSGAMMFGPVQSAGALIDLLRAASVGYATVNDNSGRGRAQRVSVTTNSEGSRPFDGAMDPGVSCVVRIIVTQSMSATAAHALGGGAAGAVAGMGCVRADGSIELKSTLLLVCAPTAAGILGPLAESAAAARVSFSARDAGEAGAAECLFPAQSRETSSVALQAAKETEAAIRKRVADLDREGLWASSTHDNDTLPIESAISSPSLTSGLVAALADATQPPSLHPLSLLLTEPFGARIGGAATAPAVWFSVVLAGWQQDGVAPSVSARLARWVGLLRQAVTHPMIDTIPARALLKSYRRSLRVLRTALRGAPLTSVAAEERMLTATREALDAALDAASLREETARLRIALAAAPTLQTLAAAETEARELRAALQARKEEHESEINHIKLEHGRNSKPGDVADVAEGRRRRGALIDYALALRRKVARLTPDARERATLEALESAMAAVGRGAPVDPLLVEARLLDEATAGIGTNLIPAPDVNAPPGEIAHAAQPYVNVTSGEYASFAEVTARARAAEAGQHEGDTELSRHRESQNVMRKQLLAARSSLQAAAEEIRRLRGALADAQGRGDATQAATVDRDTALRAMELLKTHAHTLADKNSALETERSRLRAALAEAYTRVTSITDLALKHGPMVAAAAAHHAAHDQFRADQSGDAYDGHRADRASDSWRERERDGQRLSPGGRAAAGGEMMMRSPPGGRGGTLPVGSARRAATDRRGGGGGGGVDDEYTNVPRQRASVEAEAVDRALASQAAANTMLTALEGSEKRCIELLGANAGLAGQVEALRSQLRAVVGKYETGLLAAKKEIDLLRRAVRERDQMIDATNGGGGSGGMAARPYSVPAQWANTDHHHHHHVAVVPFESETSESVVAGGEEAIPVPVVEMTAAVAAVATHNNNEEVVVVVGGAITQDHQHQHHQHQEEDGEGEEGSMIHETASFLYDGASREQSRGPTREATPAASAAQLLQIRRSTPLLAHTGIESTPSTSVVAPAATPTSAVKKSRPPTSVLASPVPVRGPTPKTAVNVTATAAAAAAAAAAATTTVGVTVVTPSLDLPSEKVKVVVGSSHESGGEKSDVEAEVKEKKKKKKVEKHPVEKHQAKE